MSSCMYTAQGDFVCQENEDTKDNVEHFNRRKYQYQSNPPPDPTALVNTDVPFGEFRSNCRNCSFTQSQDGKRNKLNCDCANMKTMRYQKTELSNCFSTIINNKGKLDSNIINNNGKLQCK